MSPFHRRGKNAQMDKSKLVDCSLHHLCLEDKYPFDRHQQDLDYTRGFSQGVWFMRQHGHLFNTDRRWWTLWSTLSKIRRGVAEGKLCLPLMWWLRIRFKLPN